VSRVGKFRRLSRVSKMNAISVVKMTGRSTVFSVLCVMEGLSLAIRNRDWEPFSTHSMNLCTCVCVCVCVFAFGEL
jgi:hypothetical protein